ncbi:MAG: hypothetical protein ACXW0Q_07380 [Methylovulum sp.]
MIQTHEIAKNILNGDVDSRDVIAGWSISQRAMLGAAIEKELKQRKLTNQKLKDAWIASARKEFSPGSQKPCVVCGKYKSVAQAHHTYPLYLQFDKGVIEVNQNFVWLCPTHHSSIHLQISSLEKNNQKASMEGFPADEIDQMDNVCLMYVNSAYNL